MIDVFNYQALGMVAAILVAASLLPSAWRLLTSKDLSRTTTLRLFILVVGCILWIMYGFRDSSPAIVLFSICGFAIASILFVIKLRSKKSS